MPEWNRLETDESYLWPFIVYWLGLANYRDEMETEIEQEEEEEEQRYWWVDDGIFYPEQ